MSQSSPVHVAWFSLLTVLGASCTTNNDRSPPGAPAVDAPVEGPIDGPVEFPVDKPADTPDDGQLSELPIDYPTDPLTDGLPCPPGEILRYFSPGCGEAARPTCGSAIQDACFSAVCSCRGQTISRCNFATEPFCSYGPCGQPGTSADAAAACFSDGGVISDASADVAPAEAWTSAELVPPNG